jgi:alpha-beta hydrolase superfamily lysophospholipase
VPELSAALLDNLVVLSVLFHPRQAVPEPGRVGIDDGTIPVEGDIVLGYRLYVHKAGAPVIVLFHGNGEIASDYDDVAAHYHRAGASLLVVDYRGYGWSTGWPLVSALLSDTEAVRDALPAILRRAGLSDSPLFVMGRSLGSACAIHLAYNHSNLLKGIIIESGFAQVFPLLAELGVPVDSLGDFPDPIDNVGKIQATPLPLLVIHGEQDSLIPIADGESLFDASPAPLKSMIRIGGAGHNDLLFHGMEPYFTAIARFIMSALSSLPETLEL